MRKFILIPYDIYNTLLSSKKHIADEDKLTTLLNDETMDISSKNVYYNQALQNLIKQKREETERPLKVDFVPKPITLPPNVAPTISVVRPTGLPFNTPFIPPPPTTQKIITNRALHRISSAPMIKPQNIAAELDPQTPVTNKTAKYPSQSTPRTRKNKERDIDNLSKQLYDKMIQNNANFGITKQGEIINPTTGTKYTQAQKHDARRVIKTMLGSKEVFEVIAGSKALQNKIKQNPNIFDPINNFLGNQSGNGRLTFKPELWTQKNRLLKPYTRT